MSQALAFAKFARATSDALLALAAELEATDTVPDPANEDVEVLPEGRGERQKQILALAGLDNEEGMKTSEVANAITYDVPNTYTTLQALERAGLIQMIPGVTPQRWRLAPRYRNVAPVFMRLASRVRDGEWTTYGDISIAVRGDTKAARGVGRAAAAIREFPHPERVLMDGGLINEKWHDSEGRGPDYCQKLLEEQGIWLVDKRRADPSKRVTWDVLCQRDNDEPVAE